LIIKFHLKQRLISNGKKWLCSLKNKSSQWASCYTWSNFKMGMDSTVRSGSMNSFVSKNAGKMTSAKDLCFLIESYGKEKTLQTYINRKRNLYVSLTKDISIPLQIEALRRNGIISGFIFTQLKIQVSQLLHYSCVVKDPSSNPYDVKYSVRRSSENKHIVEPNPNNGTINETTGTHMDECTGYFNFGQYRSHQTTITTCSCQYPTNFGSPCRHILRVWFSLNFFENMNISFSDVVNNTIYMVILAK